MGGGEGRGMGVVPVANVAWFGSMHAQRLAKPRSACLGSAARPSEVWFNVMNRRSWRHTYQLFTWDSKTGHWELWSLRMPEKSWIDVASGFFLIVNTRRGKKQGRSETLSQSVLYYRC